MNTKITKQNTGFTLIETIVSLAIFSSSIVALISVTASGVADTNFAKNKLTASYLAQEGVEMVRNIRDSISLSGGTPWLQFITTDLALCTSPNGCMIDPKTLIRTACTTSLCSPLNYETDGFFGTTGSASPFTRVIKVKDIGSFVTPPQNEIKITSTVNWNQGSSPRSVTYSENLFDWIQ